MEGEEAGRAGLGSSGSKVINAMRLEYCLDRSQRRVSDGAVMVILEL